MTRLGKQQLRALVAIANGYVCVDYSDRVCLALQQKHMLTRSPRVSGWVATQSALEWLKQSPDVMAITSTVYYVKELP